MLVFIIPVKHPARSRSYETVTKLLKQTLHSVCRQTSDDFRVIVISNRTPRYDEHFKNTSFVQVDFPPPKAPRSVSEEHSHVYLDKGCKQAVGLIEARRFNPDYIMFTDADDLVSCRLAEFTKTQPSQPGWFMEEGLVYSEVSKIIKERSKFWSYCGTSHILNRKLLNIPDSLSLVSTQQELIHAVGLEYLTKVLGDHNRYREVCASQGAPLIPLPFVGAIWRADTGENSSRDVWGQRRFGPIWGQVVTPSITEEFGLACGKRTRRQTLITHLWRVRHFTAKVAKSIAGTNH